MESSDGSPTFYELFRPDSKTKRLTREEWVAKYKKLMSCHPVRLHAGDGEDQKCKAVLDRDSDESVTILTLASIYYDRFMRTVGVFNGGTEDTFGSVFGTACVTAIKFACEHRWTMSVYAEIMDIPVLKLEDLEIVFLTRLDHRLWVSREEYEVYAVPFRVAASTPPPLVANSPALSELASALTAFLESNLDESKKEKERKTRWATIDYDADDTDDENDWPDEIHRMDRDGRESFFSPGPGSRVHYVIYGPELPPSKRGVKRNIETT